MRVATVTDLEYVSRVFTGRIAEFCDLVFKHVLYAFGLAETLLLVFSVNVADIILNAVVNTHIVFLAVNRFLSVKCAF